MKNNEIRATGAMPGLQWVIDKCKAHSVILLGLYFSLLLAGILMYGLTQLTK